MKKAILSSILMLAIISAYSQVTDAEKLLKTPIEDTLMGWKKGGLINITTSQTSLTNWAAGGQSSISVNGLLSVYAHNKKEKSLWENYLDLGYGSLKQKGSNWWKTDDRIDFTSKYGLKAAQNLYYAALLNFKTQMAPGFNYPNDSVEISNFLAPGYLLFALGMDYVPITNFTVYVSPITYKLTIVKENVLADDGAFGVEPGYHFKSEFGGYLRTSFQKDLMENISLQTKLELFSNYLKDFGNIDVSWETILSMKVNKFISVTVSTHLLYDHDITIKIERKDGEDPDEYNSKVQFKEVLAVGLSMKF